MLEMNPFLEAEEEIRPRLRAAPDGADLSPAERVAEREADSSSASESSAETAPDEAAGVDSAEYGATEREDWENGTERDDFDGIRETPSSAAPAAIRTRTSRARSATRRPRALQEHLREQLLGMRLSAEDAAAISVLIESLDDDGYLADSLEEIAAELAARQPTSRKSCSNACSAR